MTMHPEHTLFLYCLISFPVTCLHLSVVNVLTGFKWAVLHRRVGICFKSCQSELSSSLTDTLCARARTLTHC